MFARGVYIGVLGLAPHRLDNGAVLGDHMCHVFLVIIFDDPDRLRHASVLGNQGGQARIGTARKLQLVEGLVQPEHLFEIIAVDCVGMLVADIFQLLQDARIDGQMGDAPRTTFTNTWVFGVTEGSDTPKAANEYLGWLTDPALEREVLLDPELKELVSVHFSNLRDPEVNARWGGIHAAAAEALTTAEGIEFGDNWLRVVEVIETAISSLASGETSDVRAVLDKAAADVAAIRG